MFISKKAVIAGVSTLVLVGGGAALALFTTQATTTETVAVADVTDGELTLDADLSGLVLYPGVSKSDIVIRAANANTDVPFEIDEFLAIGNSNITLTDAQGNCPKNNFVVTAAKENSDGSVSREGTVIPAGATATRVGFLTIEMLEDAGNGCQGASLAITIRADASNATS